MDRGELECGELTERIIGAAIQVQRTLGPGFIESIYENALVIELQHRGLKVEQQIEVPISYRDRPVGTHRLDLRAADSIVVELKAIKALEDVHFSIVRSYLRATRLKHGLLLNFSKVPLDVKRVIYDP